MTRARGPVTLAVDVGATGLKTMALDGRGRPASDRLRIPTPSPATPRSVLLVLRRMATEMPRFDRVAVGFPGVVVRGVIRTAANLDPSWIDVRLDRRLERMLGKPTRVANDADVQGLAVVLGRGVELVVTLGTGIGSALFLDGRLVPNLELGHHPFQGNRTYEDLLGDHELKRIGLAAWIRRLRAAVDTLDRAFNPDRLYLGGGNARLVRGRFRAPVHVADNVAGLLGGFRLWHDPPTRPRISSPRAARPRR